MLTLRSAVVGLLLVFVAYQFAPSPLLPVEKGDAIVVTGSHTGIGKHAALTLAKEGYTVFACVRKPEHGEELLKSAEHYEIDVERVKPIILDVTKKEQIEAAVETVSAFVGDRGLYGLFNNAGIGTDPVNPPQSYSVEHFPMESYRRMFEVNFFGLLQVTKAFLPLVRRRRGRIISNTSGAGIFSGPFVSCYAGSKFAVEALSDSLRRELDPHGVRVSVLEPGYIATPIFSTGSLVPEGEGVYAEMEQGWFIQIYKAALDAHSPRVTSEAVVHAMRAKTPKTRYLVGQMIGITRVLASLPDTWADAVLRAGRSREGFTEEELQQFKDGLYLDFEL